MELVVETLLRVGFTQIIFKYRTPHVSESTECSLQWKDRVFTGIGCGDFNSLCYALEEFRKHMDGRAP